MELRQLDLNLLVVLDALLSEHSVTRAAQRLRLSQPAVSGHLKTLRQVFGDPLLVSVGRGMAPSARALELAAPLKAALGELQSVVSAKVAFDPATAERTYRIAATDAVHAAVSVPLVARLHVAAPGVRIALVMPPPPEVEHQLEAGEVDVALVNALRAPASAKTRELFRDEFVTVVRTEHPLLQLPANAMLDAFCRAEHLLVSPRGGSFDGPVDAALAALGRKRRVRVSVASFLLVAQLLAESDLVTTLPMGLARRMGPGLATLPTPIALHGFSIVLAWHPRTHQDPGLQWLRTQILEQAART